MKLCGLTNRTPVGGVFVWKGQMYEVKEVTLMYPCSVCDFRDKEEDCTQARCFIHDRTDDRNVVFQFFKTK